jgi:D-alanyl-D-alanine carboxypeptidase (penicillin-binding protein 5/6)
MENTRRMRPHHRVKTMAWRAAFFALMLCVCMCVFYVPVRAEYIGISDPTDVPEPEAKATYVLETTTGICIYGKNAEERLYPASTTKLMTALLIVEEGNLSDVVTFSAHAVNSIPYDSMHISIQPGEQLTLDQVLHAILIQSANEACMGAAEHIFGSVEAFVARMNERATELGAVNTHFANPHGLHDEQHYTTSIDLALIMQEVMKNETLRAVMSKATYTIPPTNKTDKPRYLTNSNRLIHQNGQYYNENIICGKTGFTTPAGNTLVTYGEVNGLSFIIVIMKAGQGKTFQSTSTLIDYFEKSLQIVTVANVFDYAAAVPSANGELVYLQPKEGFTLLSYRDDPMTDLRTEYSIPDMITEPVREGTPLGTISVYSGDRLVGKTEMVARADYGLEAPVVQTTGEISTTPVTTEAEVPRGGGMAQLFRFVLIAGGVVLACFVLYLVVAMISASRYRKRCKRIKNHLYIRERNGSGYDKL